MLHVLPLHHRFLCYIQTMTITQTVEIPADRRVFFEFLAPQDIPEGKAQVEVKVTPVTMLKNESARKNENKSTTPHTDALFNLLAGIGEVNIDEIREERLAKHLK